MSYDFEMKVFRLTSRQRTLLDNGEKLFKKERNALGVEKYFDIDYLSSPIVREQASETLNTYQKQLTLEKNFYTEFHISFVKEINRLASDLSSEERDKFLLRCIPELEENNSIRMNINNEKSEAITKLIRIISLLTSNEVTEEQLSLNNSEDINEIENLLEEINLHLDKQENLAISQRKRGIDGQRFFERIINLFRNA